MSFQVIPPPPPPPPVMQQQVTGEVLSVKRSG